MQGLAKKLAAVGVAIGKDKAIDEASRTAAAHAVASEHIAPLAPTAASAPQQCWKKGTLATHNRTELRGACPCRQRPRAWRAMIRSAWQTMIVAGSLHLSINIVPAHTSRHLSVRGRTKNRVMTAWVQVCSKTYSSGRQQRATKCRHRASSSHALSRWLELDRFLPRTISPGWA